MTKFRKLILLTLISINGIWAPLTAQKNLEVLISDSLTAISNSFTSIGRVYVTGFSVKENVLTVKASDKMNFMPFRPDNVKRIYKAISSITARKYSGYTLVCLVDNRKIEDYIPDFYKTENKVPTNSFSIPVSGHPLVQNTSRPFDIKNGLQNRHIALWQSHGWYYNQKKARWQWQRARIFQTVEDVYTLSYVLPFLTPMLENAGAYVLMPRERDTQINEVIVDNDTKDKSSQYREQNDRRRWKKGEKEGFSNTKKTYLQGENPFTFGSYREITSMNSQDEISRAEWIPALPEAGKYAVYVSFKSVENSTTDARYTVIHRGEKTEFSVNQTMSGGTWLYLGQFYFDKGKPNQNKVVLTNIGLEDGKIITADAVKFGGGIGNIARSPFVNDSISKIADSISNHNIKIKPAFLYEPETSHRPRFSEGARYWLQWAGIPDSVYSRSKAQNDYSDDFNSRPFWVNYLAGGSVVCPNTKGLAIPIDLSLAFHSDAGTTPNDSIVGTLGIHTLANSTGSAVFSNGISRWVSRDLADIVQTQIVEDVQKTIAPEWIRRGIWNKSYSETRNPEVPSMILELLSHQNFADMRYGLDPRFKFTVSRAVYKGILKYLSSANQQEYVVQPLPVEQFSCQFSSKNKLVLNWKAVTDTLEPSAKTEKYVVYTRIDEGDFDNGRVVNSNTATLDLATGKIYSFKVTAINKGGESFPSEILSAYRAPNEKPEILIVNAFTRISAPQSFSLESNYAGFYNDMDAGVPYIADYSFTGKQFEFKRNLPWVDDDAPGFGASYANFETKKVAGNTFDYPFVHGKAFKSAGYSFVSCSVKSVENQSINILQYKMVDLILGKQKQTFIGNSKKSPEFKTFPLALQNTIQEYTKTGGNLLISGTSVLSDTYASNRSFFENTLKSRLRTDHASLEGVAKLLSGPYKSFQKLDFSYYTQPNSDSYSIESTDAIEPYGEGCFTICRYNDNNLSAGIAYSGAFKLCVFGFPIESIKSEKDRESFIQSVLLFFQLNSDLKK